LVRSSVVPEGTAMLFRTMVAQEVLDLLADAALVNVHVARSARPGASVGSGVATGAAETNAAPALRRSPRAVEK
jgi:hypothetical protein